MPFDELSLGATVRAWRDRVSPASAGLPSGRVRRAKGLRREDLAELAGISVDYVVRLEQGRATNPSAQVLEALARALQLTDHERDHLYRLAHLAPPSVAEVSDRIPPGLGRLLNRLADSAAIAVFAADWQLIWWNRAWASLLGDPSGVAGRLRNFARDTFPTSAGGPHLSQWSVRSLDQGMVEAAVVADLRRASGRFPDSTRIITLVRDLTANERFAELWSAGAVGSHREDDKVIDHPAVGPLTVQCDVVVDGDAERKVVMLSAAPDTEDYTKFQLAVVSGIVESSRR